MKRYFSYFLLPPWLAVLGLSLAQAAPRFPTSLEGLEPSDRRPAATDSGFVVNPAVRETARLFYNTVYRSSVGVASGWNGSVGACQPGTTSSEYQSAILRRINWFRAMAGLPANIVFDSGFSAKAQQAALMMSANNQLNHYPPASWTCYTAVGAEAAGKSNLSIGLAGYSAIDGYIKDAGSSNSVVGHRRWILYPQTQIMGTGDVVPSSGSSSANALWVMDNHIWDSRPAVRDDFIAWPPKGYAPYQTVYPRWSLSYPDADFSAASVIMTRNGSSVSVTQEPVDTGYGENTLVWIPNPYTHSQSWSRPAADESYQVTVNNVLINGRPNSFYYNVTVFDPAIKSADYTPQSISGSSKITAGQATTYTFSAVNNADSYQWRQGNATNYVTANGAESGLGDFTATISSGYSATSTGNPATGNAAYHLAHPQLADQMLTLNKTLLIGPAGNLQFFSYLGYATASQSAIVEVSEDDGQSWTPVYQQAGKDQPESGYSAKVVPLNEFVGKAVLLRFRYQIAAGDYYPQTVDQVGWSFDDVRFSDVASVNFASPEATNTLQSFVFSIANTGNYLLQVRPLLFGGFPSEWSAVKAVEVTGGTPVNPPPPVNPSVAAMVFSGDYNGDGRADVVWHHAVSGQSYGMLLNGFAITDARMFYHEPNTAWRIVQKGDLDGNGQDDLLWWNNQTGQAYWMPMNGLNIAGGGQIHQEPNTAWQIVAVGDLNGDGKDDLIWWNNATGQVWGMLMNGGAIASQGMIYHEPNTNWQILAARDFTGDGKADLLWRNSATGQVYLMPMSGLTIAGGAMVYHEPNLAWSIVAVGDFDNNQRNDLVWWNSNTGQVYGMQMNGYSISTQGMMYHEPNTAWGIVASGDYTGDGKADLLWRNSQTGQIYEMAMNGLAVAGGAVIYQEANADWRIVADVETASLPPPSRSLPGAVQFAPLEGEPLNPYQPFEGEPVNPGALPTP